MPSYYATVTARVGMLLGGVRVHRSSRFETAAMARDWLEVVIAGNNDAGAVPNEGTITRSDSAPEITAAELEPAEPYRDAGADGPCPDCGCCGYHLEDCNPPDSDSNPANYLGLGES